jgi:hypothetical protein
LAPAGNNLVGNDWLKVFDLRLSYPIRITERFRLEPSIAAYNLFNLANFTISPGTRINTTLAQAAPDTVNGNTYADRASTRAGIGSGVFSLGAPRQLEYGLRIIF